MKAFLEFDMADPDDRCQHADMLKAQDTLEALRQFDNALRHKVKYEEQETIEVQAARDLFWKFLVDRGIELY